MASQLYLGWKYSFQGSSWSSFSIKMPVKTQYAYKQVSFKKEVGVMVIDLVFWLTVCLILKMCY